jgi:5-methylcytosine-specific restriction endonuclease McrA
VAATYRDLPCADCGQLMWRTAGSLPAGEARCQPCRRSGRMRPCAECGISYEARLSRTRFCSRTCANRNTCRGNRIRTEDDPHLRRSARDAAAPGLSGHRRSRLLAEWKRQRKVCAYCPALATTVDHVVPLVRGGTNYEGNLVPCCKSCNSSKSGWLVIEWRTGKRLQSEFRLAWESKAKREPKPAIPTVARACYICLTTFVARGAKRVTCGNEHCAREHANRCMRDRYRAAHDIPIDRNEPSAYWRRLNATKQRRIL